MLFYGGKGGFIVKLGIVKKVTTINVDSSKDIFKSTIETTDDDNKLTVISVSSHELFNKNEIVQVIASSKVIKAKRLALEDYDLKEIINGLRVLIKAEKEKLEKERNAILPESLRHFNERLLEERKCTIDYLSSILSKLLKHGYDDDNKITDLIEDTIDTIINADNFQEISYVYWMTISRLYLLGKRFHISEEKLNRLRCLLLDVKVCDIKSDLQAQKLILQREKLN